MSEKAKKERSRHGYDLLAEAAAALHEYVARRTDAELRAMARTVPRLHAMDCFPCVYEMRSTLADVVASHRLERRKARREMRHTKDHA